jgi:hypothetical protein
MKLYQYLLIITFTFVSAASATTVSHKGFGVILYEPVYDLIFDEVPAGTEDKAAEVGIENAWKRYVATFSSDRRSAARIIMQDLNDKKDQFIIDKRITATKVDKDNKKFTSAVRIEIDDTAVEKFILDQTLKGDEKLDNNTITWLFITRGQESIKSFDDRIVRINSNKSEGLNSESQTYTESDANIKASAQNSQNTYTKNEAGGSTIKKSDTITRKILSSKEIDSSMRETLVNAGYEGYMYGQIAAEPECGAKKSIEEIREEFASSVDISSETQRDITKTAKRCDMNYTAIGTLDVLPAKISKSGNTQVNVSVTAQVFVTSGRFARNIASVGPIVYAAEGVTEEIARFNALRAAGKAATTTIINQLRSR